MAGGVGGLEGRSGSSSSGCSCAGFLRLSCTLRRVAVFLGYNATVGDLDVRFDVMCGVDLASPGKGGRDSSVGRL